MNLEQLLSITSLDIVIKLQGIKNRIKSDLAIMNYINDYQIIESWKYEEIKNQYGEKKVLCQWLEDKNLVILIDLN